MDDEERALLEKAARWLQGANDARSTEALAVVARDHGIDFATAVLYQALRASPRHGPFIERVDGLAPQSPPPEGEIAIVPGAFYRETPHSGADGHLIRQTAEQLGHTVVQVPLHSFGRLSANAAVLAGWLEQRGGRPVILVSHSKAATEIRHLLTRPEAPVLLRHVVAWVDLSGLFQGTPLIGWLRRQRLRRWLTRLLFWWKGYSFPALAEIDRDSLPPWPQALAVVPWLRVIHVVGLPLQRHLTTALARRGHRRLAPLGPNDSAILLGDVLTWPGLVYPVWGADHYLRPAGRDLRPLVARILRYLGEEHGAEPAQSLVATEVV